MTELPLTSIQDASADPFIEAKRKSIITFSGATVVVFLLFGAIYLQRGVYLLGGVELILGLIQLINIYLLRQGASVHFCGRILVYSVYFMSLVIFVTGGIGSTGYLWILFIPLFTMLILDQQEAAPALALFVVALTTAVILGLLELYPMKYDVVTLRQSLIVFALFLFLNWQNERLKVRVRDELQRKNELLEISNRTDSLTQVANRAALNEAVAHKFHEAKRYGREVSLILMDLDHFKAVNDSFGHLTGDRVLIQAANILQRSVRATDLVGRWGGEEFMVVMVNTTLEQAQHLAEKLRATLAESEFPQEITLTASFGVTQLNKSETTEAWVNLTDNLLYRAKEQGRNCQVAAMA
ncbi:MAG: diguanylate cyclase [Gammaproteobacteria bacterium]|nr:diguanylate cyclase [Gammaproteobacteria bacterium]